MTKENNEILITKEQLKIIANIIEYLAKTLGTVNGSMDFIQDPRWFKFSRRNMGQLRTSIKYVQEHITEHNDLLTDIATVLKNPGDLEVINHFLNMTEEEKEKLKNL